MPSRLISVLSAALLVALFAAPAAAAVRKPSSARTPVPKGNDSTRHPVPREHPRLYGSLEELRALARQRPQEYQRMAAIARGGGKAEGHAKMMSLALVAAIEGDQKLGRQAVQLAMTKANGPILHGHKPFAHDAALCAVAFDLCYPCWSEAEKKKFYEYLNATVDANVNSEMSVFHDGWWGYKVWGVGLACYATYYENPRSPAILKAIEEDYRLRAAPALEMAGNGGGWAEGYYIHYWLYEWLNFCEAARRCEGIDYYAMAPDFYRNRAVAGMFEEYPGIAEYNTRKMIPMGDGDSRVYGGDRDQALCARRILVSYYRDDPANRVVHIFNETTPRVGTGSSAYKDFLWHDTSVKPGDVAHMKLSRVSTGPGYVYARSSWGEDATYFFFKCGDRFTSHQHLDVNHFLIYKYEELAGDGGNYDSFGSSHDVNYHMRTIAHNSILVYDPSEMTWNGARAGPVSGNDGGQMHAFPNHNGGVQDPKQWEQYKATQHIAQMLGFVDWSKFLYVAGDATRAYSPAKLEYFTRQIVFCRPDTFVIFDRVKSKQPAFRKTWLLQAMQVPTGKAPNLVITNGKGRLFVQTLLPAEPKVQLFSGANLYSYGGKNYPPDHDTGPAPQCRIEVSPSKPAAVDYFLHVLTAANALTAAAPRATVKQTAAEVCVTLGPTRITFTTERVGGRIQLGKAVAEFPTTIKQ